MPKCEKVFVIMKWILQWKGGRHALGPRQWSLTNMTLATWHCHDDMSRHDKAWQHDRKSEVAAYNFLFAGKEGVALEALRPVDGDEGEHVGEGGVCRAVGDPGQGHG